MSSGSAAVLGSVALVLAILIPAALTVVVCWIAYRRTKAEPRRLSNAYWLLGGVLLLIQVLAALGLPGAGSVLALFAMVIIGAPVLALILTVFLILNGIQMLRRESVSPGNLLSLLLGLALLALMILTIPVIRTDNPWLICLLLVILLAAGYLGFRLAAFIGYSWLYRRLVRNRPADWIVVLGSGLGQGGRVTPLLASRIRTGMAEAARREARVLIMSGGKGDDEARSEAEAMGEWAEQNGVDPGHLLLESHSRNTQQNLTLSYRLVQDHPELTQRPEPVEGPRTQPIEATGLIVTSNYHVMRAAVLARRLGVPAQAAGAPTAGYYWPSAMIREYLAILFSHRLLNLILLLVVAVPLPLLILRSMI